MGPTISRDELKRKIDLKDHFLLVETLPATAYHHADLPGAINLKRYSIGSTFNVDRTTRSLPARSFRQVQTPPVE